MSCKHFSLINNAYAHTHPTMVGYIGAAGVEAMLAEGSLVEYWVGNIKYCAKHSDILNETEGVDDRAEGERAYIIGIMIFYICVFIEMSSLKCRSNSIVCLFGLSICTDYV